MEIERSTRLAVAFARIMARPPYAGWCGVCVDFLDVTGAGITIMGGDSGGPLCASSEAVGAVDDVQYTAGEGPGPDAFRSGLSVLVPAVDASVRERWPIVSPAFAEHGFGAVFAYPLTSEGAKVGVLSLYQARAGSLSDDQHQDSLAMAEVLTETVLSLQDAAPHGTLATEIDDVVAYRAEIHQAAGMVAVQAGVPTFEAMVLLRAHAFAHDMTLLEVSRAVVDRRLRLGGEAGSST